jgi:hypothetical protein
MRGANGYPAMMKSLASRVFPLLAIAASSASPLLAGEAESTPAIAPAPAPSKINALFQLDVSDHYITPRGLNVENDGIIFQPLMLFFANLYSSDTGFVDSVSLTAGMWSSIHTEKSGPDPGHWNEFDPIAGFTIKFADIFKFDTTWTAFDSMVDAYPTSHHLELKLSLDDSKWLGAWALSPYVAFWQELENKATVVFNQATSDESFYFTLGINPSIKFDMVKIEFPTFMNIVDDDFYQQFSGAGGGDGIAVVSTGIKASVPLTFIPEGYGHWTWYAGVKYYHLSNDGLEDGNLVVTPDGDNDEDVLIQFLTGFTAFF